MKVRNFRYVTSAYIGDIYYFPTLGEGNPVRLDFRLGWGEVQNGAIVQIRTEEYLQPMSKVQGKTAFAGIRNFLGAWKDRTECYYYSTDDAQNYEQQYWTVSKIDGSSGPICYGDEVYIASDCPAYRRQKLTKHYDFIYRKTYISTEQDASDSWIIEQSSSS